MKISFRNKDKLKLVGILSKPKGDTRTCVILAHGATVDKDEQGEFVKLADLLTKAGFAVFRFDFRGHGESEGDSIDMTISDQKEDLEAALSLLVKNGYRRFGVVAASFSGGAVSLFAPQHQNKIKAIVYLNSVLDYKRQMKRWLAGGEAEKLKKNGFILQGESRTKYGKNLIEQASRLVLKDKLKKLKIPVLFIHGDKDTHVPYQYSIRFAKLMGSEVKIIHGSEHGFHDEKHSKIANQTAARFFLESLQGVKL